MKKRLVGIIVVIALVLSSFSTTCFAADLVDMEVSSTSQQLDDQQTIIRTLQDISQAKEEFGFDNIDFSQIAIGANVPVYEYVDGSIKDGSYRMYPLYENNQLIAVAVVTPLEDNQKMAQIYRNIADDVNKLNLQAGDLLYFVYDVDGFNIVCNNRAVLLSHIDDESLQDKFYPDRLKSTVDMASWDCNILSLGYTDPIDVYSANAQTYYSINVTSVHQGEGTQLCWAASITCIGNYRTGRNATLNDVRNGDTSAASLSYAITRLNSFYGLQYTYISSVPSDNRMFSNIINGWPLYACFHNNAVSHAVVIYGINIVSGYITVMDPFKPSKLTAYSASYENTSTYGYTSPYSNTGPIYLYQHGYGYDE